MDIEDLRKEVIINIRSCLVSTKGNCDLNQINRDYRLLMGSDIPYSKLGFKNLEQLICSIPSLKTSRTNNILYVDAKQTDKSAHISALVKRQKTRVRRHASTFKLPRYTNSHSDLKSGQENNQRSSRVKEVKHAQFVNRSPLKQKSEISSHLAARLGPKVPENTVSVPEKKKENDVYTMNKQRLFKLMEDMKVDVEPTKLPLLSDATSYVTDIDSEFIASPVQEKLVSKFTPTGDHLADLKNFAFLHELGEVQIKAVTKTGRYTKYYCHIKVGTHSYSSYPLDCHKELDAQQEAAKKALDELTPMYNRRKSFLISDKQDILSRIPIIVQSHSYGIWKEQLEADYEEKYMEKLPGDWLNIVDTLPNISITQCLEKFMLQFCKAGEKGVNTPTQCVSDISVPTNSVTFDANNSLLAKITCPVSASEIWCQQIETPKWDEFEKMAGGLEGYCRNQMNLKQAITVDIGGYYLALAEDEMVWCRVRVFNITNDLANCFCIDYGDELEVQQNKLYVLPREFSRTEAQAFVCRLMGVEELYEASKLSDYITSLFGKVVYVDLQENDSTDDLIHNVLLIDAETNVIINEQLQFSLEDTIYKAPELNVLDTPTEVFLTHAEVSGVIYVRVPYFGSSRFGFLLEDIQRRIKNNEIVIPKTPVTFQNSTDKLYLVKRNENDDWCRARILEWAPCKNFAQIQYVDYGSTSIIHVANTLMCLLEEVDETLAKFTDQAKQALFALEHIPSNFVDIIKKLVGDDPVLAKVQALGPDGVPLLKLFKRSSDNLLFSINDALVTNIEISSNVHDKSQSLKLQRLITLNQSCDTKIPSAGILKAPVIPAVGEYFDVRIPLAVNPYLFFVQPFETKKTLWLLMTELQEKYKSIIFSPLSMSDIIPGNIYASKYIDTKTTQEIWLRTSIIKVINPSSISVFYCDYGYSANLTLQQIFPIEDYFLSLPFQAIKAKLSGILPKRSKWSSDDCKFFENLVYRRNFISVIRGKGKDVYCQADTVLSVDLIDTSTSKDIFINQILVDEGIATST